MEKEQKNKKKTSKKGSKILKVVTCTLAGILLATVAIFGVYTQKQNRMDNVLNGYSYGMDLKGGRTLILTPSIETSSIVKDSEGNEVENSSELTDEEIAQNGYTKEEVADNQESDLTVENYKNSKEIIEKRLKELDVKNYNISLNELCPISLNNSNSLSYFNPFNCDTLYLYYYTNNILISSVIELYPDDKNIRVRFYNGIKDIQTYSKDIITKFDNFQSDLKVTKDDLDKIRQNICSSVAPSNITLSISWSIILKNVLAPISLACLIISFAITIPSVPITSINIFSFFCSFIE